MSDDPYRLRKRKTPCRHEFAKWNGNSDWPGLVCAECGVDVEDTDYEDEKK